MKPNRQTKPSKDVSVYPTPAGLPLWRQSVVWAALLCVCLLAVAVLNDPVQTAAKRPDGRAYISAAAVSEPSGTLTPCNALGGLDTSFGTGGMVRTGISPDFGPDSIYAMALQSDGKIVAAGGVTTSGNPNGSGSDFALARYNSDGSPDQTFGTLGSVITDIGSASNDGAFAVALQPDGKIVVAGFTSPGGAKDVAIVRYNSNGSLDQTFGTLGKKIVDMGSDETLKSLLVQPDGRIVVLIERGFGGTDGIGLPRYLSDGSPDNSFGTGGVALSNWGGVASAPESMAIQSDGKLLLAGWLAPPPGNRDTAIARYNADGTLDSTFGSGGVALADLGGISDGARSVAVQPDGMIVTGGISSLGSPTAFTVARFTPEGSLDPTFGTGGKTQTVIGNDDSVINDLAIAADGRIIAAGWSENFAIVGFNRDFAAVRYNPDGSLDTTFNGTGIAKTAISTFDDHAYAVVVQPDGRFLVGGAGMSPDGGGSDFTIVRYKGNCEIAVEGPAGQGLTDGSATPVDLGPQPVGSPATPKTFTIRNVGTEPLSISAITVDGAHSSDFTLNTTGTASALGPNASTTFSVIVTPGSPGLRTAALRIQNSDQTEAVFDINLTATGISGVMYTLTVATTNGSVSSGPVGINCPSDCSESFNEAAVITLTALPQMGYRFVRWEGDATGSSNPVTVAMSGNKNVTAVFERPPDTATMFDFDGDRRADIVVRRPSTRTFFLQRTSAGFTGIELLGQSTDRAAPADYDGDGTFDLAVFRSNGTWLILRSETMTWDTFSFGQNGDLPLPADRDADGDAEPVVYRPSNGTWYTRFSAGGVVARSFGIAGDKPLLGDFDGDGSSDLVVYRPSENNWYFQMTSAGFTARTWGEPGDIPAPADYDGDRVSDMAVYRPSLGRWYVVGSTAGWMIWNWGEQNDVPVPSDYDGDGRADAAVYRPSTHIWYVVNSSDQSYFVRQFGEAGDVPLPSVFVY